MVPCVGDWGGTALSRGLAIFSFEVCIVVGSIQVSQILVWSLPYPYPREEREDSPSLLN